jgi:hypothetical protein
MLKSRRIEKDALVHRVSIALKRAFYKKEWGVFSIPTFKAVNHAGAYASAKYIFRRKTMKKTKTRALAAGLLAFALTGAVALGLAGCHHPTGNNSGPG